jgi:hypothetical protein
LPPLNFDPDRAMVAHFMLAIRLFLIPQTELASKPFQQWTVDEIIAAIKTSGRPCLLG